MENTNQEDLIIQKVKSQIDSYKSEIEKGTKSVEELETKLKSISDQVDLMPKSLETAKKEIMDILIEQGKAISSLKELRTSGNPVDNKESYKESLVSFLKGEQVKNVIEGRDKSTSTFRLKSETNLTSNYAGTTVLISDNRDKNIYTNPIVKTFIGDLLNYIGVTKKRDYAYLRETDIVDLLPNLSENTSATELSLTLTEATATAKRISAYLPVSKWMIRSVDEGANYIMRRLPELLKANMNFQMLYGSGAGAELKGLFKEARTLNIVDGSYIAGAFASVATYDSGAKVIITFTANHGLYGGETLTIANSANYNGSYTVTVKTKKQIVITVAYNAEATGAWTGSYTHPFKDAVVGASKLDALVCAISQVSAQELFTVNVALVSPIDYWSMLYLNKATTAEVINPNYIISEVNGVKYINGIALIPNEKVTAGEFLLGDFQNGAGWLDYTDEAMGGETIQIIEDTATKKTNSVMVFVEREIIMPVTNPLSFVKGVFATIQAYILKP